MEGAERTKVEDLLSQAERSRMTDTETQAPEVRRAKLLVMDFKAVVTSIAAALLMRMQPGSRSISSWATRTSAGVILK